MLNKHRAPYSHGWGVKAQMGKASPSPAPSVQGSPLEPSPTHPKPKPSCPPRGLGCCTTSPPQWPEEPDCLAAAPGFLAVGVCRQFWEGCTFPCLRSWPPIPSLSALAEGALSTLEHNRPSDWDQRWITQTAAWCMAPGKSIPSTPALSCDGVISICSVALAHSPSADVFFASGETQGGRGSTNGTRSSLRKAPSSEIAIKDMEKPPTCD